MTFDQFKSEFDTENSTLLFASNQEVSEIDLELVEKLAQQLANSTEHFVFRSGCSNPAEELFCKEIAEVDSEFLEIITPYTGFKDGQLPTHNVVSLDDMDLLEQSEIQYQATQHQKFGPFISQILSGNRHRGNMGAAFTLRDMALLMGADEFPKSTVVLTVVDTLRPERGPMGFLSQRCDALQIPVYDQRVWGKFLL